MFLLTELRKWKLLHCITWAFLKSPSVEKLAKPKEEDKSIIFLPHVSLVFSKLPAVLLLTTGLLGEVQTLVGLESGLWIPCVR